MNSGISFGEWLKARRKALDLTQRDLALRLGYSLESIVKIETGERRPSRQAVELLVESLRIPEVERATFARFARGEAALAAHPNNLPSPPTAFIGRTKTVSTAASLLGNPATRLLTLTGPPGIGKTRLALQVAGALLPEFEGGVYFVPLAAISDPHLVALEIAALLGVRESARRPLTESLLRYLRERRMLLILDNFEQVADAAPLVSEMLAGAAGLKVLVTSRFLLQLYGEHELRLPLLTLPDRRSLPPVDRLLEYEGLELFVERARAVEPDFVLTEETGPAVAEICRRLDGLPLAIELAAARTRFLSPPVLLERLKAAPLKQLTVRSRDLPPRQQTLRRAIAWSYDLLDPGEQRHFRLLGIFLGGFTPEAAVAVGGKEPGDGGRWTGHGSQDWGRAIQNLADKNLLRREGDGEEARFGILETIREYALEQLRQEGEAEDAARQHALYYLALAEQGETELRGPHQNRWLDRLDREHDNLRAALRWAKTHAEGETAARLVGALGWFWFRRGYLSEGREKLAGVLAGAEPGASSPAYGKALYWAARFDWRQGDQQTAEARFEQSLAAFRAASDDWGTALSLLGLGTVVGDQGDLAREKALYEESLALWRRVGDRWGMAQALHNLGYSAAAGGDFAGARAYQEQSLALFREIGDPRGIAAALGGLGPSALAQGDYSEARALYGEGLETYRELGDKPGIAGSLVSLGEVARCEGDYPTACLLIEESLVLFRELGDKEGMAMPMHNFGHALLHLGAVERAARLFGESLLLFQDMQVRFGVALGLAGLAGAAAARQQPERAARLFGAADALIVEIGAHLQAADLADYEHNLALARSQLDAPAFDAALSEGRALPPEESIAYALDEF